MAFIASTVAMVIEHRKYHACEAARLRLVAITVTTPTERARLLEQAEEHAILAGLLTRDSEAAD
jgi:hypothetical protein